MKNRTGVPADGPFLEFSRASLRALYRGSGIEIPLERDASGRIATASRTLVARRLEELLGANSGKRPALCTVPARGISLRRLKLPKLPAEELERALALKLEADMPVDPRHLAWGHRTLRETDGQIEVCIFALKREFLRDYEKLLEECGLDPFFRVGAFVSRALCEDHSGHFALLDIGSEHAELTVFEGDAPVSTRALSWGGSHISRVIAEALSLDAEEAEKRKLEWRGAWPHENEIGESDPEHRLSHLIESSVTPLLEFLAQSLRSHLSSGSGNGSGRGSGPANTSENGPEGSLESSPSDNSRATPLNLYLSGGGALLSGLEQRIHAHLGNVKVSSLSSLSTPASPGTSTATLGLQRQARNGVGETALTFSRGIGGETTARPTRKMARPRLWALVAALLTVLSASLHYLPGWMSLPSLERQLVEERALLEAARAPSRELLFLKALRGRRNAIRELDLLTAIARCAPVGTLAETIHLSERGVLTIQGTVDHPEKSNGFRRNLILCGLFARVVIEDTRPVSSGFRFRILARAKPEAELDDFRPGILDRLEDLEPQPRPAPETAVPRELTRSPKDTEAAPSSPKHAAPSARDATGIGKPKPSADSVAEQADRTPTNAPDSLNVEMDQPSDELVPTILIKDLDNLGNSENFEIFGGSSIIIELDGEGN